MGVAVSQKEKAFVLEAVKQGYLNKQRADRVFQKRQRILTGAAEKQKLAEENPLHKQKLLEQAQNDQKKAKVWQLAIVLGYMTQEQARAVINEQAVQIAGQNGNTLDLPSIVRPELTLDFMGINIDDMIATAEKAEDREEARPEDRYKFIKELGKGGMGTVGLYKDLEMDREVAIKKILAGNKNLTEDQILRFQREMEITGKLYRHKGIIQIFDFGRDSDNNLYIAMEVVHGRELSKIIKQAKEVKKQGNVIPRKYSLNNMMKYFMQALDALQFMHSNNYVHRDLKPDNIMIDEELEQAKIMDLGLAKKIGEQEPDRKSDLDILLADSGKTGVYNISEETLKQLGKLPKKTAQTLEGQVMGTPAYMSPDQINNSKGVDQRADIYSMGVILYEILTGEKPHKGETPINTLMNILKDEAIAPINKKNTLYEIPKELSAICMTALSKDPKYRYRTVKAFLDDIQAYIANEPVSVYKDNLWERIAKWGKRNKRKAGMLIGAAMLTPVLIGSIGVVRAISAQKELTLEQDKTKAETIAKKEAQERAKSEKGRADAETKAKTEAEGRADAEAKAKTEAEGRAEAEKGRADAEKNLRETSEKKRRAIELITEGLQVTEYARNIQDYAKQKEKLEEAVSMFTEAVMLDNTLAHAYNNMGLAFALLGRDKEALQQYTEAIRLDPKMGKAYGGRGSLKLLKLNDLDGAIADFEKAKEYAPLHLNAFLNLAVCYFRKGEYRIAIENCDKALEIQPTNNIVLRNKGESYLQLGQYREAEENLKKAVVYGHIYSNLLLAKTYLEAAKSGNPLYLDWKERARDHCAKAVRIDSSLAEEAKGILEKIK